MTSNIIYLSSDDEGEDPQMISTQKVRCQGSPKILGAVSSTTVNHNAVTEPHEKLSAPVASYPEERMSILGPKAKSFDLGHSKPCSGLAMARAASAPQGSRLNTVAAGVHRIKNLRATASIKGRQLAPAFAFPTTMTASKAVKETSSKLAGDLVKQSSNGTQAVSTLATRSESFTQRNSTVPEHLTWHGYLPRTTAAVSVSPQAVTPVLSTVPFASRALKAEDNTPKKPTIHQNTLSNHSSKRGVTSTAPSLDEPLSKRQRVEAQPEILTLAPNTSAPLPHKRLLWTIPAYIAAKVPSAQTDPTTTGAATATPNAPALAPRPASTRLFKGATTQVKNVPKTKTDEVAKTPVAPNASPKKTKLPPTAKLFQQRTVTATQAAPSNLPAHAPGTPPLPTITATAPTPTTAAPRKPKPWTSREYAELAQIAYHSFPFAVFAATHGRSEPDVMRMYSAIIQLPIFSHSAKGLAQARVTDMEIAEEEMRAVHRAEEGGGRRGLTVLKLGKGGAGKGAGRG